MPSNLTIPFLVAFGTDYTLWPFYLIYIPHGEYTPPFTKDSSGTVIDSTGKKTPCYEVIKDIFEHLTSQGRKIAVISRRGDFNATDQLLNLFGFNHYVSYKELYQKNITEHFRSIHKKSGIKYSQMLYFDDILKNIEIAEELGVYGILVQYGMTWDFFQAGMDEYQRDELKPQKTFNEYLRQWDIEHGFDPDHNPFPDEDQ